MRTYLAEPFFRDSGPLKLQAHHVNYRALGHFQFGR